jgi:hypothetical protein
MSDMSPEQQLIKIAEACGWKWNDKITDPRWVNGTMIARRIYELPNYPADLNAMHEAEKVALNTSELRVSWAFKLRDVVYNRNISL